MTNNNTPDRASDFDEEIPTYAAPESATPQDDAPHKSVYERAGRVAPQTIPAQQPTTPDVPPAQPDPVEPVQAEAAEQLVVQPDTNGAEYVEPTTVLPGNAEVPEATTPVAEQPLGDSLFAQNDGPNAVPTQTPAPGGVDDLRSQPLASDAPTSVFDASAPTTTYEPVQPEPAYAQPAAAAPAYNDDDFAPAQPATQAAVVPPAQPVAPVEPVQQEVQIEDLNVVQARRGTIDFGVFLLRVVVGAYLVLTAVSTFFGIGENDGIQGLNDAYTLQGYAQAGILSVLVPALQLTAGVFLLLGLITPIAAALATAVTAFGALDALDATTSIDVFNLDSSVLFAGLLAVVATALQFTGPGKISFDVSRSWAERPLASSWIFVIIGIGGAVAMWWFLAGVNPLN